MSSREDPDMADLAVSERVQYFLRPGGNQMVRAHATLEVLPDSRQSHMRP